MSADVELQNVSVSFGNFYAAKNVSVKIEKESSLASLDPLAVERQLCFAQYLASLSHLMEKS
jgi:hypothetical protein